MEKSQKYKSGWLHCMSEAVKHEGAVRDSWLLAAETYKMLEELEAGTNKSLVTSPTGAGTQP
jgi:hypothetical protein